MAEPRPVHTVVTLTGLATLGVTLWLLSWPAPQRWDRLVAIARGEQASLPVPTQALAQVEWLVQHRLRFVTGMVGLVLLAAVIGISEGLSHRRHDLLKGVRLKCWTIGVVLFPLSAGMVVVLLILPVLLMGWPVAPLLAALAGLAGFCVAAGRPVIP